MVSWGGAASGATTGATIGSVIPGIGTALGAGIGGLAGLFMGGKKKDTELEDLRSPEQIAAQTALAQLGQTGSYGGITLGEQYGGSLGNYDMTGMEQSALGRLAGLGQSDIAGARSVYQNAANTQFNPQDPSSGFAAFSRQVARATGDANDVLNRESAITGNRFGTAILGQKTDLAAQQSDMLATKLAELYNQAQNRQMQGAQGLQSLVGTESGVLGQQLNAGGLSRDLQNQQAQVQYNEFNRQRAEKLGQIDLMTQTANRNPYSGVSSIPSASPFSALINSVLGGLGSSIGESASDKIAKIDLTKLFGGGSSSPMTIKPFKN